MTTDSTTQIYEVYIRTTPEKLWQALVDPELTKKYFFGTMVKTTAKPGEAIVYSMPDGKVMVEGEVLASEPPYKLVHTWIIRYDAELEHEKSKLTWTIEKLGAVCKLTAVHELPGAPKSASNVRAGWPIVLSGMKTLLETGEPLKIEMPASA